MRRTQTTIEPPAAVLNGHVTSVTSSLDIRVLQTVEAAKRYLFGIQQDDGHWVGELEGDTILETEYALLRHFMGNLDTDRLRQLANQLRRPINSR